MRLVIVESPYAAPTPEGIERNLAYGRACLADCLLGGEAPYASHLLYTQPRVLRDEVAAERELGICAGLAWGRRASASAVYVDLGVSQGMIRGIDDAHAHGRAVEIRRLSIAALERAIGPLEAARAVEVRPMIDALLAGHGRAQGRCGACGGAGFLAADLGPHCVCAVCGGTGRR